MITIKLPMLKWFFDKGHIRIRGYLRTSYTVFEDGLDRGPGKEPFLIGKPMGVKGAFRMRDFVAMAKPVAIRKGVLGDLRDPVKFKEAMEAELLPYTDLETYLSRFIPRAKNSVIPKKYITDPLSTPYIETDLELVKLLPASKRILAAYESYKTNRPLAHEQMTKDPLALPYRINQLVRYMEGYLDCKEGKEADPLRTREAFLNAR